MVRRCGNTTKACNVSQGEPLEHASGGMCPCVLYLWGYFSK